MTNPTTKALEGLETLLEDVAHKLDCYYEKTYGEYVGGIEHSQLQKRISATLTRLREQQGEADTVFIGIPRSEAIATARKWVKQGQFKTQPRLEQVLESLAMAAELTTPSPARAGQGATGKQSLQVAEPARSDGLSGVAAAINDIVRSELDAHCPGGKWLTGPTTLNIAITCEIEKLLNRLHPKAGSGEGR